MLEWDLSETAVARDAWRRPPSEGELQAILVALSVVEDCALGEMCNRRLVLTRENREQVAATIEQQLGALARDVGTGSKLRERLTDLTGLAITSVAPCG
jgi:hypothetical protein